MSYSKTKSLVVEAERVPVVSYPAEWPVVMLRYAGAMIARLGAGFARRDGGQSPAKLGGDS
jgi:hypothetical protein